MVVGEAQPDGTLSIIGVGEVKSEGVLKGEISDHAKAIQCISDAWTLAQDHSDSDIMTVYLAVTGAHIKGVQTQDGEGSFRLPENEHIISAEHMEEAAAKAQNIPLPPDQFILHRVPGLFTVDGQENLSNPEGLSGRTLDIKYHIIYGTKTRITNSLRCVREVPLDVEDIVFAPLAAAQLYLSRKSKEAGALLIDMGAGTTDYVLYTGGQLVASGCIPLGGDHITNDISLVAKIPWALSEVLKKTEGDASSTATKSPGIARVKGNGRYGDVAIERALLNELIQTRVSEIFSLIKKELPKNSFSGRNSGEVYLCGGASLMRGAGELASNIFNTTINQPEDTAGIGVPSYVSDPRFATAIGLIRYAQVLDAELPPKKGFFGSLKSIFSRNN